MEYGMLMMMSSRAPGRYDMIKLVKAAEGGKMQVSVRYSHARDGEDK
jgi:hypothetical protein